jgi:uncharacterized membrane protein (Fun14 family)
MILDATNPVVVGVALAIGVLIGFVLGYAVRAFISRRRHQAARRRSHL